MSTIEMSHGEEAFSWVGRPMRRKEDPRLIRGQGQFIADMKLPGMLHVHFIRSRQAHARIVGIDLSKALAIPGVVAGFTAEDLLAVGMREMLIPSLLPVLHAGAEMRMPRSYPLAVGKTVFHGEPLAILLAENRYALEDAAELVQVHYEALPIIIDPEAALEPGASKVFDEWPDNVLYRETMGNGITDAFDKADIVIEERYEVPRTGCSPLELRGILTSWSDDSGLRHVSTTQRPHLLRTAMSEVLGIPDHMVRVITPKDQGGAFGTKAPLGREDFALALVAKLVKRPLRWIETREEHFRAGYGQERGQIHYLQIAATKEGKILGMRNRCIGDVGDGNQPMFMGLVFPKAGCFWMPSVYNIPQVEIELVCVATNKPCLTPSRSFGSLPGRFALDRSIDRLARKLGLDPVVVRRSNLVDKFPHVTGTWNFLDSGDYLGGYDTLVDTIDLVEFRRRQRELREQGRFIGVGFAGEAEMSGVSSCAYVQMMNKPGYGAATVRISAGGTVLVLDGDPPAGQSHETVMAQVMADEFGLTPDEVQLEYGDTLSSPYSMGAVGNRMAAYTASAAVKAARVLKEKMARVAAHDLGIDAGPEEFRFVGGEILWDKDPSIRISFNAVAKHLIVTPLNFPSGVEAGLEHTAYYEPPADVPAMFGSNFHAAIVEVDPDSGQFLIERYVCVDDSGKALNPLVVEGQCQGGVVMGIGNSIFEEFHYNERGELQNVTLEGYMMPSAADVPHIEHIDHSIPTPYTLLGTRGKGEGAPGPVPATIANAIEDALSHLDLKINSLPLRPERIRAAIARALGIEEEVEEAGWNEPAPRSFEGEGEGYELLAEMYRFHDGIQLSLQPMWHPYQSDIRMWLRDFGEALDRVSSSPELVEFMNGMFVGEEEVSFDEAASLELTAAWMRLEELPRPDGGHAYLDYILPAFESHQLLMIALSRCPATQPVGA
ncbi:MAG: xanthine dehydrogenase family protein molybdopterin-binding subunit [Thermomicrobiales bacterium]